MAGRFDGKVAIVTGAAGGVGQALVARLVADGARVAAVDVRADEAARLAESYPSDAVLAIGADVSASADVEAYVDQTVKRFGGVHLFCNNAGVLEIKQAPIVDLPVEDFDRVHRVNVRGVFLGLKYVMRQMIAQGRGGAIVNTASVAGLRARATASAYGSSKRAVIGLSNSAAMEGGPHNIRVNAVCPGGIDTPMAKTSAVAAPAGTLAPPQAIQRLATPAEIANFICYLLSDEASYQTGGVHTIDGGLIV